MTLSRQHVSKQNHLFQCGSKMPYSARRQAKRSLSSATESVHFPILVLGWSLNFVAELFLDLSSPSSNNRQSDHTNIELYTGDHVLLALERHCRSVSSGTPLQVSLQWHATAGQSPVARHCRSVFCGTPLQVSLLTKDSARSSNPVLLYVHRDHKNY